jgi:L-alanine-DL-glutamate epimerase-like enolase superfamily enzyme
MRVQGAPQRNQKHESGTPPTRRGFFALAGAGAAAALLPESRSHASPEPCDLAGERITITGIDTFVVRTEGPMPWLYCAVRTDAGITGYSEFGNGKLARGLPGLVQDLAVGLIGEDARPVEKLYFDLYRRTRHAWGGAMQMAIAGIELALWDVKAKALGVPVYELVGGPFRTTQRLYWSHLATYRAHKPEMFGSKPLRTMDDVAACAAEAVAKGYTAFKTNIVFPGPNSTSLLQGASGANDQNLSTELANHVVAQIAAMRSAAGPDADIALDTNYNFKTEGVIRLARELEPYKLMWLEYDNQDPAALAQVKASTWTTICSGEQLVTVRQFKPYFDLHAMDFVKVDVQWQGFSQAKKVADLAEVHDLNIAPHNYNSHLSTFQSIHLAAAVSNVKIMEYDVDSVPIRDELATALPSIEDGHMTVPRAPGWGCDLDEAAARRYAYDG